MKYLLGRKTKGKIAAAKPIIQKTLEDKISGELVLTVIGLIIAVIPKTEAKLNIFEPIRLPSEIALSFLKAAITEAASSGTLVPTATIVTEIAYWLTPKYSARSMAPLTNHALPK